MLSSLLLGQEHLLATPGHRAWEQDHLRSSVQSQPERVHLGARRARVADDDEWLFNSLD